MTSMTTDRPTLEIHYAEEWAALYVDGKLDRQGDTYWVEERAFELAGVTTVRDDAFLRGGSSRDETAKTLQEVGEYRRARLERRERAAQLREEAARLEREAQELIK
jgi:hypothetical protein